MKKYISGLITGLLMGLSITVMAAVPGIKTAVFTDKVIIEVNGVKQPVEVISVVKEGQVDARNFVSVGDLAPAMGGEVKWNGERQAVEIAMNDNKSETLDFAASANNDEWLLARDLVDLGIDVSIGVNEIFIYEYYNSTLDNKLLLHIEIENNTTPVRAKIENQRTYVNKADLIRAGIITE